MLFIIEIYNNIIVYIFFFFNFNIVTQHNTLNNIFNFGAVRN